MQSIQKFNQHLEIFSFHSSQEFKSFLDPLINVYISGYKGLEEYAYTDRRDVKRYLKWLYNKDPQAFFIAILKTKVVGFVAGCRYWHDRIYGEIGELHELVVDKPVQEQGIGRALQQIILSFLFTYHKVIGLWAGEKNKKAIKFYQDSGFKIVGQVGKWLRMIKEK